MKHCLKPILALATTLVLVATSIQAQDEKKMIIALSTDDFELSETDISTLAVGEAKTIETDNGRVIDILRTTDGAEVYVDGVLLEMNFDEEGLHEEHMIVKHVEVICDPEEDCEKHVVIHVDSDDETTRWLSHDGDKVIIHKEIEITCTDEDDETTCSDELVWISEGEETNIGELHKEHADGQGHRVIVIEKKTGAED
jgi:hypothetical protein